MSVRPAVHSDLPNIVKTHISAFPKFYLTELGSRFLCRYYALVLNTRKGILLVYEGKNRISGFISGFVSPAEFYSEMKRIKYKFLIAALPGLVKKPRRAIRFAINFQRMRLMSRENRPGVAELSSIAVVSYNRRKHIGRDLVIAFKREVHRYGARNIVLTTDAHQNEQVNQFYQKMGFRLIKTTEAQPGRWLNEYIIDLIDG